MVVAAEQVLPIPHGVSLEDAASLPEVACTVWSTVFMTSRLSKGETFLVTYCFPADRVCLVQLMEKWLIFNVAYF